ncbi:hypothetical protein TNCV_3024781 [Trichonephila clavipes]|nr:hypothetical protein TNCV_3024781 [Trichonephila clavipes]
MIEGSSVLTTWSPVEVHIVTWNKWVRETSVSVLHQRLQTVDQVPSNGWSLVCMFKEGRQTAEEEVQNGHSSTPMNENNLDS